MASIKEKHAELQEIIQSTCSYPGTAHFATPLAFDRINEGQPFASNSFLARLPIELTWQIMQLVPKADLASLALVNVDCRQLARSRQFAAITLDFSDRALGLLETLCKEANERLSNEGQTKSPSLGACLRHITVATDSEWIGLRQEGGKFDWTAELDPMERTERLNDAFSALAEEYFGNITSILSNPKVLPHLETLIWQGPHYTDQRTLKAIMISGAKSINIRGLSIDGDFILNLSPAERRAPIRSLFLDLAADTLPMSNSFISPLIAEILTVVAPTVESLVWCCYPREDECSKLSIDRLGSSPSFPNLKDFKMGYNNEYDPAWLKILIQPGQHSPIRCLDIDTDRYPETTEFFRTCGTLSRLETLVWHCYGKGKLDLSFLRNNSHIRKLMIPGPVSSRMRDKDYQKPMIPGPVASRVLDNELLLLLSQSFHHLTSLSLAWKSAPVSQEALALISTLSNLEQLSLSAGEPEGWMHEWEVNHHALQASMRSLSKLRKLALNRDTYAVSRGIGYGDTSPINYYRYKRPRTYYELQQVASQGESFFEYVTAKWEEQHRQDMLNIAKAYADVFPNLDWVFLGQLPMGIEVEKDGKKRVVLLSEKRDSCALLLCRMFGRENEVIMSDNFY